MLYLKTKIYEGRPLAGIAAYPKEFIRLILNDKVCKELNADDFDIQVALDYFYDDIYVYIKHIPSGMETRCGRGCDRIHDKLHVLECIQNKIMNLALFLRYY